MPLRVEALVEQLAGLLRDVEPGPEGLEAQLERAVGKDVAVLDVDGAGLMLLEDGGRLRLVGASDAAARALELGQQQLCAGPCLDAARHRVMVLVADLEIDERWPGLWELLGAQGVRGVMSAPVWLHEQPAGSLNVFTRRRRDWSRADRHALKAYAGVVAVCLRLALDAEHQERVVEQLRRQLLAGDGAEGLGEA